MITTIPTTQLRVTAILGAQAGDGELLAALAGLLATVPGTYLGPRLSDLAGFVCSACGDVPDAGRTERLVLGLAAYLNERHVLRSTQVTVADVDSWAGRVPLPVVRAALVACSRQLAPAAGGGAR